MPRARKREYDGRWTALSRRVRAEAGWQCEVVEGGVRCSEPATSTDHIVPVREAPELRLVRSNLRATCARHNMGRVAGRLMRMAAVNTSAAQVREW